MFERYRGQIKIWYLLPPLFTLIATFYAYTLYLEQLDNEFKQKFEFSAIQSKNKLESRLYVYTEALNGLYGLYAASKQVTRAEFSHYVDALQLDERYPGFQALSFNRRINHQQKEFFEREVRNDTSLEQSGYPDFAIKPAGRREEYIVIDFVEPKSGNEKAFGFDIASNPIRLRALNHARDTGLPIATGPITLVQESDQQSGFLLFKSIYTNGLPLNTAAQRQQAYTGVVVAVFRLDNLLKGVLSTTDLRQFTVIIHDDSSLFYKDKHPKSTKIFDSSVLSTVKKEQLSAHQYQLELDVGGRSWRMSFQAKKVPVAASSEYMSIYILNGGITLSLLLFGALYSFGRHQQAIENSLRLTADLLNNQQDLNIAATVFEHSSEALMITDIDLNILAVNPAFTEITGYSSSEVLNQTPRILQSRKHNKAFYERMRQTLKTDGRWQGEQWNRRKDGTLFAEWLTIHAYCDSEGKAIRYVALFRDITEDKKIQQHIQHLAYYDSLTELANRALLKERMANAIRLANSNFAVLFIDLDRFKTINDSLGHHIGDKLLQLVSTRIKECVRASDTVARLGGDEFVILLHGLQGLGRVVTVMSRISNTLGKRFHIDQQHFHVTASTGISLFPKDGTNSDVLLKHADTAMYQAKEAGRNNYQYFNSQMNKEAVERLEIEHHLHDALKAQQLELYYQPQVDIKTQHITGFEALIRWAHPTNGMIPPDSFIPIAEESDLILSIGDWVFMEACRQGKLLQEMGETDIKMAVNLSARQFGKNYDLVKSVKSALTASGLRPELLELEITETVLMEYKDTSIEILTALHEMGVSLSLDDFGTGYSSLSYLRCFPVDAIKIDRSFISNVTEDQESRTIVAAIINLAHNLKLNTIAEGVETMAQLEYLESKACDTYQGYFCSKPVPAEHLQQLLEAKHRKPVSRI